MQTTLNKQRTTDNAHAPHDARRAAQAETEYSQVHVAALINDTVGTLMAHALHGTRHPPTCLSFMRTRPMARPYLTDWSSCTQPTRSRSLAGSFIPTRCRHALSHFADPDYVEYPSVPFGSPLRACRPGLCCGADHRHGDEHLLRREGRERDQARHAPRKPMHTRARTLARTRTRTHAPYTQYAPQPSSPSQTRSMRTRLPICPGPGHICPGLAGLRTRMP